MVTLSSVRPLLDRSCVTIACTLLANSSRLEWSSTRSCVAATVRRALTSFSCTSSLTVPGSTLRSRPPAYKGRIARELVEQVWPLLEDGRIRTHICGIHRLEDAAAAQAVLDANAQIGKLVLTVSDDAMAVPEPAR